MFYVFKGYVFAAANLRFAFTHDRFFFRREHVIRIHKFFRLNDDRAFDLAYFHEVSDLEAELVTNLFRDDHLAALAKFADGHNRTPSLHCTNAIVHTVRLSDGSGLSTVAADGHLTNIVS